MCVTMAEIEPILAGFRPMYTRKNAQVVTNLLTSCQQVVFALLVPSLL